MESVLVDSHMEMKETGNRYSVARFNHSLKYLVLVPGTLVRVREFVFGK